MNCFLSGAIVRTGGSQSCIGGAPSVKYSYIPNPQKSLILIGNRCESVCRMMLNLQVLMLIDSEFYGHG